MNGSVTTEIEKKRLRQTEDGARWGVIEDPLMGRTGILPSLNPDEANRFDPGVRHLPSLKNSAPDARLSGSSRP